MLRVRGDGGAAIDGARRVGRAQCVEPLQQPGVATVEDERALAGRAVDELGKNARERNAGIGGVHSVIMRRAPGRC